MCFPGNSCIKVVSFAHGIRGPMTLGTGLFLALFLVPCMEACEHKMLALLVRKPAFKVGSLT